VTTAEEDGVIADTWSVSDERCDGDRVERVLSAQQWRVVCALLDEGVISADPILREGETIDPEEYITVCYELHHVLLPELAERGLIEFDIFEDQITRGTRFDELHPFLDQPDSV
jgi:hypothetical protein